MTRRAVRDRIRSEKVMERAVRDIQRLLLSEEVPEEMLDSTEMLLWDEHTGGTTARVNFSGDES